MGTSKNALVAPHASMWAANRDPNTVPAADVAGLAQANATFMAAMGGDAADLYFIEWSDRDAGCDHPTECSPPRPWWDVSNRTLPRPSRAMLWANALSIATGKRLILWQVPSGNMALDNTCTHYRDNRPAYAFSHPRDLVDAGIIATLFGGGAGCSTQPNTDGGFIRDQGAIAYDPPAAPTGLTRSDPLSAAISLRWAENSEPDLWGYRVQYQPTAGGAMSSLDAGIANATALLLPQAGDWRVSLVAYDALGQLSPAGDPLTVTIITDPLQVYLPLIVK